MVTGNQREGNLVSFCQFSARIDSDAGGPHGSFLTELRHRPQKVLLGMSY